MRLVVAALELGVILHADVEIVFGHLDGLYDMSVRRGAAYDQAAVRQKLAVVVVELITVTMPLVDQGLCIALLEQRTRHYFAGIGAEAHRAAFVDRRILIRHEVDDLVRAVLVELAAVRAEEPRNVARKLDHRDLHVVTNNLNIAATLTARDDVHVYLTGGAVCNRDGRLTGEAGCDFIRGFRMEYCLLEAWALDDNGQLFAQAAEHVPAEQLMLDLSRQCWLTINPHARAHRGMFHLENLSRFDQLFTVAPLSATLQAGIPPSTQIVSAEEIV